MAEKYKSSFKDRGFKPREVSNAGVNKILQEGQRQVDVLKQQFNYEKQQRDYVLAAMKENASNEKADREQYFRDETQNRADIQERVQDNFRIEKANIERQGRGEEKLYQALSNLSKKASEKVAELQQDRFDKDYEDELNKILIEGPDYFKQAEFQTQEDQLMVASAENEIGADALAAAGAPPYQAQKVRSNSKGRQYARNKAQTMFAMQGFMPYAQKVLQEQYPQVTDPEEKQAVIYSLIKPYMQEKGVYGLKPEFLTPALMETRKAIGLYMSSEREIATKNMQLKATEESAVAFLGNPKDIGINTFRLFNDLRTANGGDRSLALKQLFETALELTPAEIQAFGDITLPGQKDPIRVQHERRFRLLETGKTEQLQGNWDRNNKGRQIKARNYEDKVLKTFNDNPTKITAAGIEQAQLGYRAIMGVDSDKIKNLESSTITAKGTAALKIYLTDLANTGKLSPEILSAVSDRELRKEFEKDAEEYAAKYQTPEAKRKKETLKTLVLAQGKRFSPEGRTLTPDGEIVLSALEAQFDERLTQIMANKPELTVGEASNTALLEAQRDFEKGFKDPASVYYFDPKAKRYGNVSSLGVNAEDVRTIDERVKNIADVLKNSPNVEQALTTNKGLVFTEEQALVIASSYYNPGFATPAIARKLAQQLGDMTEIDVINAQLKAYGMPELPPPPTMALLNTVPPEIKAGLQNAQSAVRSTRFLAQTGQYNEAAIPGGYGSTVTEAAKQFNIPAPVLAGLIETESAWNPEAVSSAGARGLGQFMPGTAAQFGVNVNDPKASIFGAAQYLRHLMDNYGFDLKMAIYAYNAGPGTIQQYGPGATQENADYYPKVMRGATKYGYGQQSFVESYNLRPSMAPQVAYIAGNIGGGPYYTGEHLDVKQTNGGYFEITDLDDYVEVEDPDYGRVPLSKVGVTGDWQSHTGRGSHGIDFGTATGSQIFLKNGATVTVARDSGDGNGDVMAFTLPDGREFQFLHGTLPN
tara:strand:+ start:1120 stop:4083 length:2964 start_codon:yes stop_codon:yes gene_type:complete